MQNQQGTAPGAGAPAAPAANANPGAAALDPQMLAMVHALTHATVAAVQQQMQQQNANNNAQGNRNMPVAARKIESKAPVLRTENNTDPTQVVLHELRLRQAAQELNAVQHLDAAPAHGTDQDTIDFWRRWVLDSFEDEGLRSAISAGGANAHECLTHMRTRLLGQTSVIPIVRGLLTNIRYDTSTCITSHLATFNMLAAALARMNAPEPAASLCHYYAQSLQNCRVFSNFVILADQVVGHNDFANYSLRINQMITTQAVRRPDNDADHRFAMYAGHDYDEDYDDCRLSNTLQEMAFDLASDDRHISQSMAQAC